MSMKPFNLDAEVDAFFCGAAQLTAGGSGDDTAVTGVGIDTQDYHSAKVVVAYTATLTDTKALELAVELQESDDDGVSDAYDTAEEIRANSAIVTADADDTFTGVYEAKIDLRGNEKLRKRYIRINFTPDLDASGTDTAVVTAVLLLGGKRIKD